MSVARPAAAHPCRRCCPLPRQAEALCLTSNFPRNRHPPVSPMLPRSFIIRWNSLEGMLTWQEQWRRGRAGAEGQVGLVLRPAVQRQRRVAAAQKRPPGAGCKPAHCGAVLGVKEACPAITIWDSQSLVSHPQAVPPMVLHSVSGMPCQATIALCSRSTAKNNQQHS